MKMYAKILSLVIVLLIGFSSCSKEKRIEKQLIKKDGKWKITSIDYKYYQNNELGASQNYPNAGTIEFDKKGTCVLTITLSGSPQTSAGTWTNSEDNITITADSETTVMKIASGPKKGKMTLEETDYYNDTAEKETYTYYLERAD